MNNGELIIYKIEDGQFRIQLRALGGTVWLSLAEMAILFEPSKQDISHHISSILEECGLTQEATVKNYFTVQNEDGRQVQRSMILSLILSVGLIIKGFHHIGRWRGVA